MLRRRSDSRGAGCGGDSSRGAARSEGPGRERGRPHAAPAGNGASHGLSDTEFDSLFTVDRPVVFAYHGYPWLIHRLTYRRTDHRNFHVRGYKEEGTTTTPFDIVMLNDLDRFHLVMDVIDRVPGLAADAAHLRQAMEDRRLKLARTRARTATTTRTSATGPGRSDAWAGPRRQRRIDEPEAASRSRGREVEPVESSSRFAAMTSVPLAIVSCTGAQRLVEPALIDDALRDPSRSRGVAPLHNTRSSPRDRHRDARSSHARARGGLRHRVPCEHAGGGFDVRDSANVAGGLGHPALRLSRAFGAVVSRASSRAHRSLPDAICASSCVTSEAALGHGSARRSLRRHDDGVLAARGGPDGDTLRARWILALCCTFSVRAACRSTRSSGALNAESGLRACPEE